MRLLFQFLGNVIWRWRRPKLPTLTVDDDASDGDLAHAAFTAAFESLRKAGGIFPSKAHMLEPHWRAIYTCMVLEGEVHNGGFHQFFVNAHGGYDLHLLEDISLLEAPPYEEIVKRAFAKYSRLDYRLKWENLEEFSERFQEGYEDARFEEHDSAFYEAEPGLSEFVGTYIRKNMDRFTSVGRMTGRKKSGLLSLTCPVCGDIIKRSYVVKECTWDFVAKVVLCPSCGKLLAPSRWHWLIFWLSFLGGSTPWWVPHLLPAPQAVLQVLTNFSLVLFGTWLFGLWYRLRVAPAAADDGGASTADEPILRILRKYVPHEDFYVSPDMSKEKLGNARESCKVPATSRVLALIDATVFGSARNAMVIAHDGIYYSNSSLVDKADAHHLKWPEMKAEQIVGRDHEVEFGQGHSFIAAGSAFPHEKLAAILVSLVKAHSRM